MEQDETLTSLRGLPAYITLLCHASFVSGESLNFLHIFPYYLYAYPKGRVVTVGAV